MALNAYWIIEKEKKNISPILLECSRQLKYECRVQREVSHLVSDVLVRVHSEWAEGRQDAHRTLTHTVIVVCGSKAQYSCCTRCRKRVFSGTGEC